MAMVKGRSWRCIISCVIIVWLGESVMAGEGEGEPANFEVHDKKQGDLKIHATKDKASVSLDSNLFAERKVNRACLLQV